MKKLRIVAILAASAAVAAVPASASAAPSVKDVRLQVKQANASLNKASGAALAGNYGQARSAIARLGGYAKRADQLARRVSRVADSSGDRVRAAKSLVAVAGQYDRIVGDFASLLDQVSPDVQQLIAQGLTLGADAQARIVEMLTKLTDRLPEPVAATVLAAIERFETDGDLQTLVEALASDEVVDGVKGVLTEQLDEMFAHVDELIDRLEAIDPELAAMVGGVMDSVKVMMNQVNDMLAGLFDGLLGGGIPLFPGFDDLPGFGGLFDLPGFSAEFARK